MAHLTCLLFYYHPRNIASEGYVFTGVCHFIVGGGGQRSTNSLRVRVQPVTPSTRIRGQSLPPRVRGQPPLPPPGSEVNTPSRIHTGTTVNGRAVRILLERILVSSFISSLSFKHQFLLIILWTNKNQCQKKNTFIRKRSHSWYSQSEFFIIKFGIAIMITISFAVLTRF